MSNRPKIRGLKTVATANDALVCDFCHAPTLSPQLTVFASGDYQTRIIMRNGEMIHEICTCHEPIELQPTDQVVSTQRVTGGYAACPRCARAIRANDRKRLASLAAQSPHIPKELGQQIEAVDADRLGIDEPQPGSRQEIMAEMHLGFWLHRIS